MSDAFTKYLADYGREILGPASDDDRDSLQTEELDPPPAAPYRTLQEIADGNGTELSHSSVDIGYFDNTSEFSETAATSQDSSSGPQRIIEDETYANEDTCFQPQKPHYTHCRRWSPLFYLGVVAAFSILLFFSIPLVSLIIGGQPGPLASPAADATDSSQAKMSATNSSSPTSASTTTQAQPARPDICTSFPFPDRELSAKFSAALTNLVVAKTQLASAPPHDPFSSPAVARQLDSCVALLSGLQSCTSAITVQHQDLFTSLCFPIPMSTNKNQVYQSQAHILQFNLVECLTPLSSAEGALHDLRHSLNSSIIDARRGQETYDAALDQAHPSKSTIEQVLNARFFVSSRAKKHTEYAKLTAELQILIKIEEPVQMAQASIGKAGTEAREWMGMVAGLVCTIQSSA